MSNRADASVLGGELARGSKSALRAVAFASLALGLAACGGDDGDDPGQTQLDLTIGNALPLSGELADFGPPFQKATAVALSEINRAVDEAGVDHNVTITYADTETNPQGGVQAARKLTVEGASCIVDPSSSAVSIPIFESVTSREGVLQISPASTSDEITRLDDPDGLMNRTVLPDSFQGPALADLMRTELGGAERVTVNVGARNDSYGTGLANTFSAAWEEKGGEIGDQVIYDPRQPSYDSEAAQIASGNPDAWVIVDFAETFNKVGPALVRTGSWDPKKTFVTDGLISGNLPESAGEEATEGLRGTAPGSPEKGEAPEAFDRLFEQSSPQSIERNAFDAQHFDAVMLCYLAAVAAGSTDGTDMAAKLRDISRPPGDVFTFKQLPAMVEALQNGDDIDYDGPSGPIDMDDAGDATAGVYDTFVFTPAPERTSQIPVAEKPDGGR
jgi:ABC-type branched-subunit amino acid transport system substrate-binding protein